MKQNISLMSMFFVSVIVGSLIAGIIFYTIKILGYIPYWAYAIITIFTILMGLLGRKFNGQI